MRTADAALSLAPGLLEYMGSGWEALSGWLVPEAALHDTPSPHPLARSAVHGAQACAPAWLVCKLPFLDHPTAPHHLPLCRPLLDLAQQLLAFNSLLSASLEAGSAVPYKQSQQFKAACEAMLAIAVLGMQLSPQLSAKEAFSLAASCQLMFGCGTTIMERLRLAEVQPALVALSIALGAPAPGGRHADAVPAVVVCRGAASSSTRHSHQPAAPRQAPQSGGGLCCSNSAPSCTPALAGHPGRGASEELIRCCCCYR